MKLVKWFWRGNCKCNSFIDRQRQTDSGRKSDKKSSLSLNFNLNYRIPCTCTTSATTIYFSWITISSKCYYSKSKQRVPCNASRNLLVNSYNSLLFPLSHPVMWLQVIFNVYVIFMNYEFMNYSYELNKYHFQQLEKTNILSFYFYIRYLIEYVL